MTSEKELYEQKLQAQLDGWAAEIDKLKAKASEASADAQLELRKQVEVLESKLGEGKSKLGELAASSEEAWESIKTGLDSAWSSLTASFSEATEKLKS